MFLPEGLSTEEKCLILGVPTAAQIEEEEVLTDLFWRALEQRCVSGDTDAVSEFVAEFGPWSEVWPPQPAPVAADFACPF
jgi:hypothetical protein